MTRDEFYKQATIADARFRSCQGFALEISDLLFPKLKPLSDIKDDPASIKKLWHFITDPFNADSPTKIDFLEDFIAIESKSDNFYRYVFINYEGSIEHSWRFEDDDVNDRQYEVIPDIFSLVNFIRSLGYDVKTD